MWYEDAVLRRAREGIEWLREKADRVLPIVDRWTKIMRQANYQSSVVQWYDA
jgi:hypothetical protein